MKTIQPPLMVLLAFVAMNGMAHGQSNTNGAIGPSVIEEFTMKDLTTRPGKIVVGTNVVTTLEFEDDVLEVVSGRPDFLTVQVSEVNKNRLVLRAAKSTGLTDLNVTLAAGETALFSVSIDGKLTTSKRYVIRAERPGNSRDTNSSTNPSSRSSANTSPARNPDFLALVVSGTIMMNGDAVIEYGLTNNGKNAINANPKALELWAGDNGASPGAIERRVKKEGSASTLLPNGKTQKGSATVVNGKRFETLNLHWAMSDLSGKSVYVLEVTIKLDGKPITLNAGHTPDRHDPWQLRVLPLGI